MPVAVLIACLRRIFFTFLPSAVPGKRRWPLLSYRLAVESTAAPVIRYCSFSLYLSPSAVESSLLIRQKQKKQVDHHYFLPRKTSLWGACKGCSHCSCKQFRTSSPPTFHEIYISYKGIIYIAGSYLCWRKQPISVV